MYKPNIAIIKNSKRNAFHDGAYLCDWINLQGKKILNENILIKNFDAVTIFSKQPKFINVKNLYLDSNSDQFTMHCLWKNMFPSLQNVYFNNKSGYSSLLNSDCKVYITDDYYDNVNECVKDMGNNFISINNISTQNYNALIKQHNVEKVYFEEYKDEYIIEYC